jgi:hypothetical protein
LCQSHVYAKISPEDEQFRLNACEALRFDREALASGVSDSDNGVQIQVGSLASSSPDELSPCFPKLTNRAALSVSWQIHINSSSRLRSTTSPAPFSTEARQRHFGAACGFGDRSIYSTTLVASADATIHVVRRLDTVQEGEDFGHGDLLYAADAPVAAWKPPAQWIAKH